MRSEQNVVITSQEVDDAIRKAVLQVLGPRSVADIDFTGGVRAPSGGSGLIRLPLQLWPETERA
jgi:hypothetical protein